MPEQHGLIREELDVLQADLDDESPQVLAAMLELLLGEGALDAHLTSLTMKKNRPGVRVEVLCRPEEREKFLRLLMTETSTLGVKARRIERYSLERRFDQITIGGESIRIKLALLDDKAIRAVPEFEDCRRAAEKLGRPVRDVLDEAKALGRGMLG